ncbi:hypothetical protein WJX81_007217 [Elliptochloris bilobata]|uniref:BRCT domain-containing protein n=1 Tax=Elliptochloris bilobata TaxID=381761 RepID=A0AAW1QKI5_9CHLO
MAQLDADPCLWAAGLVIATTGLTTAERQQLQALVEAAGGRYSPALSRRCSHLLAGPRAAGSRKLALARCNLESGRWDTCIVRAAWLIDSAAAGARLSEAAYALPAAQAEGFAPRRRARLASSAKALPRGSERRAAPRLSRFAPAARPDSSRQSAGSPEAARAAGGHAPAGSLGQRASDGGIFCGLRVAVDPRLSADASARVRAALAEGGGVEAPAHLGATHVVCRPQDAASWLRAGARCLVTEQWLRQSLRSGRRQPCVGVSTDVACCLHADPSSSCRQGPSTPPSLPEGHQERLRLLRAARARGALAPPVTLPSELLEGLQWTVTAPVSAARMEAAAEPAERSGAGDLDGASGDTQTLDEGLPGGDAPARPLADGEWDAVALRAPGVALLVPRGSALGLAVRALPAEAPGLTLRQLLTAIHAFYAEAMPSEELLAVARAGGRTGDTAGDAFVEGHVLARGALLGAAKSFVALLLRAGRGPASAVYELMLTA